MRHVGRTGLVIIGIALALNARSASADVVAVVSALSVVTALSKNQIADIFLGRATHFPDGNHAVPIDQAEGTLARDEFYAQFTGKSAAQIKSHWSKIIFTGRGQPPKAVADGIAARKLLAGDPSAIAYIERTLVDGSVKVLLEQ